MIRNQNQMALSFLLLLALTFVRISSHPLGSPFVIHGRLREVEQEASKRRSKEIIPHSALQIFPGRGGSSGSSSFSADWRGGVGNAIAPMLNAISPGHCLGDLMSTGYTNDIYGEDDYPLVPRCNLPTEQQYIACFSKDALLLTQEGPVSMADVNIGMEVAVGFRESFPYELIFEPVAFFLHRDPDASPRSWISLEWETDDSERERPFTDTLILAPDHLVFVCEVWSNIPAASKNCRTVAAKRVAVGDLVINIRYRASNSTGATMGRIKNVQSISSYRSQTLGLFAPATFSGTLLVDGVLVSQFSTLPVLDDSLDALIHLIAKQVISPLAKLGNRSKIAALLLGKLFNMLRLIATLGISVFNPFWKIQPGASNKYSGAIC